MKSRYRLTLPLMAMLAVSCGSHKIPQMPTPELSVAAVQERVVPNVVEFISQTQPARSYIIQPRVSGYLRSSNFDNGMPVRRGQVLFTIDPTQIETQVAQARASLSSTRADLVQAQASYDRSVPLARINAISQSQLDQATATLAAARESVSSADALLANAMLNLSYCTITAPESGIIAVSAANVGDYVGPGTAYQTLTTISFNDSISVNLSLPTIQYYQFVSNTTPSYQGDSLLQNITLTLSDGSVYPHRGIYRYTQAAVDNQSGSIVFSVRFPNADGLLKGGQFARVRAEVGRAVSRVLIPARAVNEIQGTYGAYVVSKDDTLEFRRLTMGDVVGSEWIVLEGLTPGERVITEGFAKAKSGMKIKPIEQK